MFDTVNNPAVGFYDTGEEELPDYQPDFKKLRQDHLDGKMRDDLEQVISVNACVAYGGWLPRNLGAGAADPKLG